MTNQNEDEPQYKSILCQACGTEITNTQNVAAERFHGRLGAATLYKTAINVTIRDTERRELLSGVYDVADVACRNCLKVVGWYYYQVSNKSNEWKIGKYCLEDSLASSKKVYKPKRVAISAEAAATTPPTKPPMTTTGVMTSFMSPAAVVNAVVRGSSKMMSSSSFAEDEDEEDDATSNASNESESSDDGVSDEDVERQEKENESEADEDDDEDEDEDADSALEEDVDEWEVVELIEMEA